PASGDRDPLASIKAEVAAKDRKIISLEAIVAQRETEIRSLEAALAAVYASTTWKLGAPLRVAKRLAARIARSAPRQELAAARPCAAPQAASTPANYSEWQRARLADRLAATRPSSDLWNHLFTVVIFAQGLDAPDLSATLASLHRQTYHNIEVLIAGMIADVPSEMADFSAHRGLFLEATLDPLDLLPS